MRANTAGRNLTDLAEPQTMGTAANRAAAEAFASNVLPIARHIEAAGGDNRRAIAGALNARGIRTVRGGAWHDGTVRNLLAGSNTARP
jgi:Recombinase